LAQFDVEGDSPMTGSERITEKILEQAAAAAQRLKEDAAGEVAQVLAAAKKQRETADAGAEHRIDIAVREVEQRREATLQLELRKRDLTIRQQLVDEAFQKAEAALVQLPDDDYRKMLTGMILSTEWTGEAELVVSARDRDRLGSGYPAMIDAERGRKGITGKTVFAADVLPQDGGFVIRSGEMEINGTLGVVLSGLRPELEGMVAKTLFDGLR
jgi:V/A-type H+/Na+-transporting ATPase subunit E